MNAVVKSNLQVTEAISEGSGVGRADTSACCQEFGYQRAERKTPLVFPRMLIFLHMLNGRGIRANCQFTKDGLVKPLIFGNRQFIWKRCLYCIKWEFGVSVIS